jgi:hypothetical protein
VSGVDKAEIGRWPNSILETQSFLGQRATRVSAPPPSLAASPADVAEPLGALASMYQQGLLTDAEFQAAKARVLNLDTTHVTDVPPDDPDDQAFEFASTCLNQVGRLPVASYSTFGRPIVSGQDLRPAMAIVQQVLRQELSMCARIALEILRHLDAVIATMDLPWQEAIYLALSAAGLTPGPALEPDAAQGLSAEEQADALMTAQCVMSIFYAFDRDDGTNPGGDQTYYKHFLTSTKPATRILAHQIIAWTAIVIGRLRDPEGAIGEF